MNDVEKLKQRISEVYGDKYDLSLIKEYKGRKHKYPIICPEHGIFYKTLEGILRGQGCPKCSKRFRYNTESFIETIKGKENMKDCTFENVEYRNNKSKVKIYCHRKDENGVEHGIFEISPSHLLSGQGCPKCRYVKSALGRRRSIAEVIETAQKVHGKKYDYSLITDYKNDRVKYPIICPEHGVFYQTMNNHIKAGQGCPVCGRIKCDKKRSITFQEFVERARDVHGEKYQYIEGSWINGSSKVGIICPKHGTFYMDANNHIFLGHNCPKCSFLHSEGEQELYSYICDIIGEENVTQRERKVLEGNELDIFIPNKNTGIEYNGLYWHSEEHKPNDYHLQKTIECGKKGIHLIHIFEDEWREKQEIVKSLIKNQLGCTDNRIMARKCEIREIDAKQAKIFLDENHLQGYCNSSIRIGLFSNNEMVSLMTFGKSRHFVGNGTYEWELLRFCNKLNTVVNGAASRLLKYFVVRFKPRSIVSYADRRWSDGKLYETIGFEKYNESKPNYYYIVNCKRVYRFNLRKQILVKKYGCPVDVSEREFCKSKKWLRIYDCGCLCYRKFF